MQISAQGALLRKVLEVRSICRIVVHGTSMLPSIASSSKVDVAFVPLSAIRPGDVVLFSEEQDLVVHRVLAVQGDTLITRGDGKDLIDPVVSSSQYIGKVVGGVHGGNVPGLRQSCELNMVHLWVFTTSPAELHDVTTIAREWSVTVHALPRIGIGIADATLALIRDTIPPNAVKIGVSAAAVRSAISLQDRLPTTEEVHFLFNTCASYATMGSVGAA